MLIDFNVNDYIYVKITEEGHKIYEEYIEKLTNEIREYFPKSKNLELPLANSDKNGWTKFQLWNFMQIFGEHFHIGVDGPIETTIRFEVK